jgi:hypothetical protein
MDLLVALAQAATAGSSEATLATEGISAALVDDLGVEVAGGMIVAIEVGNLIVNTEAQEMKGLRHSVMTVDAIAIDGNETNRLEAAGHRPRLPEVAHQATVGASQLEMRQQAKM